MISAIRQACQSYYSQLPVNMLPAMGRSAFFSFTASFILVAADSSKSIVLARPMITAGIACAASTIHALTNPLFNYIFENQEIQWHQEIIRLVIDFTLTGLLLKQVTAYKVNELALKKLALIFVSSHMARLIIDVPLSLLHVVDKGAADTSKAWLTQWGIEFNTTTNPTYLVI